MTAQELSNKKITMSTLKSFIKKSDELFVEELNHFSGMDDMVVESQRNLQKVEKENAIGHKGVYCVGGSRNYFSFVENDSMFGIEVYNCCGCAILWTKKK